MDDSPDICDWEVLNNSDSSDSAADESPVAQHHLDSTSDAVFQSDYFSFDSHQKPPSSEDGSASSDNPSWIDPASDAPFPLPAANPAGFLSDSGSDRSVSRGLIDGDERTKLWSGSGEAFNLDYRNDSLLDELDRESEGNDGESKDEAADVDGGRSDSTSGGLVSAVVKTEEKDEDDEDDDEKARVWWKLPLDLLKHCLLRVSPVWSLSVAAAVVGFVILGRRLYRMKRKSHGLKLKVIIDDKRVSQFMSHAARLNEAFSLVRRVPIVRPSLPAPGAAPWSVMSMR